MFGILSSSETRKGNRDNRLNDSDFFENNKKQQQQQFQCAELTVILCG